MAGIEINNERNEAAYLVELLEGLYAELTTEKLISIISLSNLLYKKVIQRCYDKGVFHVMSNGKVRSVSTVVMEIEPIGSLYQYLILKLGDASDYFFRALQAVVRDNTFSDAAEADSIENGFAILNLFAPPDIAQAISKVRWRAKYVRRIVKNESYKWTKEKASQFIAETLKKIEFYHSDKAIKINELQNQIKEQFENIKAYNKKSKDLYTYSTETFFESGRLKIDEVDLCEFFYLAERKTGGWQQCTTIFLELNTYFNSHQEIIYLKQIITDLTRNRSNDESKLSFECTLNNNQINEIAQLIASINLFKDTPDIQTLKSLFAGELETPLYVNNNQNLAVLFNGLQPVYITRNWQSIIEKNKCFIGKKGKYLDAKNLSASLTNANRTTSDYKKITSFIKTN